MLVDVEHLKQPDRWDAKVRPTSSELMEVAVQGRDKVRDAKMAVDG